MERNENYLALDFGAESGRAIVVSLREGRAELEEIHRFPNKPVMLNGSLCWDLPFLFREIISSLKIAARRQIRLNSVAVDTWGVDFGLLDCDGELIGNPVHYRDGRTESAKDNSPLDDSGIFGITGGLPWNIGSLFQLRSLQMKGADSLKRSGTFLNMPDLFNFLLCGERKSEVTIASTSLLMDSSGRWSEEIRDKFDIPPILPPLCEPGVKLGVLRPELAEMTGYSDLPVMTTCSHDTASVAAVVPERKENTAFLSSGTWSILGKILDKPNLNPGLVEAGFTNEASLDSWYMCRNITGLYPFQELKREWELSDDPWDYGRMCLEAGKSGSVGVVDLEHSDFQTPGNMTEKLAVHLKRDFCIDQFSRGEAARALLDSLALEYALNLSRLESLTETTVDTLYVLGGGIRNTYLCQKTADLCGVRVVAGIDQGTALGNGLVQAYGLGHLDSPESIRTAAASSFDMTTYFPDSNSQRESLMKIYEELKEK